MVKFMIARFFNGIVVVAIVIIINFILIHAAPGDPALVLAGMSGGATAESLAAIRASLGLDQSLPVQLIHYFVAVGHGDFGISGFYGKPVVDVVLGRLGATVLLSAAAMFIAVTGGILIGVLSARWPRNPISYLTTILAVAGYSAPVFWTGIMLLLLFSSALGWFPTSGMESIIPMGGILSRSVDVLHHLVLPAVSLAILYLGMYARIVKVNTMEALESDYSRTARAKGLSERTITWRHAFRNALMPLITLTGVQTGGLISGAILTEIVFSWPGVGTLAFDSVLHRDTSVLLGILILSSVLVIVVNLITDALYTIADPRVRAGAGKASR